MAKYTIEQLQALRDAVAKGVKRVSYEDKDVTFASIDEMLRVITLMERDLGITKRNGRLLAEYDKGLC